MELSPVTKLNKQLKSGYKSFADPSELADRSRDFTCALNGSCDLNHHPKDVPLKQLVSGSPYVFDRSVSSPKETDKDRSDQVTLLHLYAVSITFAIGLCSALGHRVLRDGGSSVDAAITAALCLGVVHPHVSGVGGGGVMLVHDIRKNKTRVIDFQGSAPKTLKEEMLQNVSEVKVISQSNVSPQNLCSLPWEDVVARAAAVAKEGFNALKEALASDSKYNSSVTELLSDMLSKNQAEVLRQRINSSHTSAPDSIPSLQTEQMAGQVAVMGPDDLMVTFFEHAIREQNHHSVRRYSQQPHAQLS
ncbi:hypothetical protein F7725_016587 [Dissostichus mawsoni]|uniref:Uncharacterized protein n=1 Tax=Dissostichus mawsoni TaxID=36200 RepID=A0A7J5Z249_DISMA|nr:hypothetical protein F7725_016587 [Dissostichus mawsoni]